MRADVQLKLVGTRFGRVVLHVAGMFRDGKCYWHLKGIGREIVHA